MARHYAAAWSRLYRALDEHTAGGRLTACANPISRQLWLSDKRDERAEATVLCIGCPILRQCREAADETAEPFGVWGGVDRTPAPHLKGKRHG